MSPLVFEEPALAVKAATVAGERTVGADDAMAGDDDADGIRAVRETDRPDCFWAADTPCEFAVGDGGAEGDLPERLPYLTLEGCPVGFCGQAVDGGEIAGEIVANSFGETARVASRGECESSFSVAGSIVQAKGVLCARIVIGPVDGAEVSFAVSDDDHLADGRVDSVD